MSQCNGIHMKFSIATQGFYSEQVDYGDSMPTDAVDITDEQYLSLYTGINSGCVVYYDGDELVLSSPRADDYQTWDNKVKEWTLTEDAAVQKSADEKERLIKTASSEITRASTQIAILTDKIELDDYDSGETAGTVKTSLIDWKKYRIACNSVVNGAAASLPDSP